MNRTERSAALLARIRSLPLPTGTVVERAGGDPYEANSAAEYPYVGFLSLKGEGGELLEVGATTLQRDWGFALIVVAKSAAEIDAVLDALEEGLSGYPLDPPNPLQWVGENLDLAASGLLKWIQYWTLTDLYSQ